MHLHLIEVAPNLGHGPLWLGYLIDALGPAVGKLSVTFPDLNEYHSVAQARLTAHANLNVRTFGWRTGKHAWRASLAGAAGLWPDLTVIPDLGVPLKRANEDLRQATGSPIHGIWFDPPPRRSGTFWNPQRLISSSARNRHRQQRILSRAPDWLTGIWVLDQTLADRITPRPGLSIHVLPDPWPTLPSISRDEARRILKLPPDATLFLHLGTDAPRKGLNDAVRAWQCLPDSSDAVLLRVGRTNRQSAPRLDELLNRKRALLVDERVPDEQVDLYLCATDWVLLPYREHHSSSGLLAGAAATNRPVVASDFGVIGYRVRESRLGLVYPHRSVSGLAATIQQALRRPADEFAPGLKRYACEHDLAHFNEAVRAAIQ